MTTRNGDKGRVSVVQRSGSRARALHAPRRGTQRSGRWYVCVLEDGVWADREGRERRMRGRGEGREGEGVRDGMEMVGVKTKVNGLPWGGRREEMGEGRVREEEEEAMVRTEALGFGCFQRHR